MKPDPRPEAAPDDVARWCEAVQTMPAEELAAFERRMRRTYQHHSLIDLIRAIVVRRAELERARRFRIKPTYQKPAGGFLAIGPPHPLESGVAVVSRISRALRVETGT